MRPCRHPNRLSILSAACFFAIGVLFSGAAKPIRPISTCSWPCDRNMSWPISFVAGHKRRQERTGQTFPPDFVSLGIIIGFPLLVWLLFGAPLTMNVPSLQGFNFKGGMTLSPEFIALLLGLVLYTAAFVAEVVRAGIQSVSKGQLKLPRPSA